MDLEMLEYRSRVFNSIRTFFYRRDYLETDTPLLAPDLIPESCLEVFETAYLPPPGSRIGTRQPYWLIPSPELWMKRIIAQHRKSVFQICRCFRNTESVGRLHSPEFTMLEYYTMGADYRDSLSLTEELFAYLLENAPWGGAGSGGTAAGATATAELLKPPFTKMTMAEAFERYAGVDLYAAAERGTLAAEARRLGLEPPPDLDTAALYDLIFIHAVEPNLPRGETAALLDYPAFVPCLAQKGTGGRTRERWELYARGIELANCYSEETSAEEVRAYFEAEGKTKQETALVPHRFDTDYWKVFLPDSAGRPFPRCSGVALGLDRLIMALTGRSGIDAVLPFPMAELTR
jgi:lysyl-tRNA synthetase class 2